MSSSRGRAALAAGLALALVATGCNGDDDGDDQPDQREGGGPPKKENARADKEPGHGQKLKTKRSKPSDVVVRDFAFHPASLTIAKKQKRVRWVNEDSVGHDVTKVEGKGPDFRSGKPGGLKKGDSFETELEAPGEYRYVCTVHPKMKGTILVKK